MRQPVGRLERGDRPGETESTTKPSGSGEAARFRAFETCLNTPRVEFDTDSLSMLAVCESCACCESAAHVRQTDIADAAQRADCSARYGPRSRRVSGIGSAPRLLGGSAMRTITWCVLTLSLVGCHSGPRWCSRNCDTSSTAHFDDQRVVETAPQPATPPPAQKKRTSNESSSRSRSLSGGRTTSQASRSKSSSRTTQTARKALAPAATTKPAAQDDSVKQLLADLEKTKREKADLETKLTEESAKQTQQRLELEARLALIQEQMRQQSALQQVVYQQPVIAMSRPMPSNAGPTITSGAPNPSMQMPFSSSTPMCAPQSQAVPTWGNSAPTWNTPSVPPQQQVEQWPHSPQRR